MNYNIIATGSKGNCTIIDNIMVDCGISYKRIANEVDVKTIDILLITHEHSDHMGNSKNSKLPMIPTIRKLIETNPLLKIFCNQTVSDILTTNNVRHTLIPLGSSVRYKGVKVIPFDAPHDVENYGYRIFMNDLKIAYCTDMREITVICREYDYYFFEANHKKGFRETKDYTGVSDYIKNVVDVNSANNHHSTEDTVAYITHYKKESSIVKYLHMSETNYVA